MVAVPNEIAGSGFAILKSSYVGGGGFKNLVAGPNSAQESVKDNRGQKRSAEVSGGQKRPAESLVGGVRTDSNVQYSVCGCEFETQ